MCGHVWNVLSAAPRSLEQGAGMRRSSIWRFRCEAARKQLLFFLTSLRFKKRLYPLPLHSLSHTQCHPPLLIHTHTQTGKQTRPGSRRWGSRTDGDLRKDICKLMASPKQAARREWVTEEWKKAIRSGSRIACDKAVMGWRGSANIESPAISSSESSGGVQITRIPRRRCTSSPLLPQRSNKGRRKMQARLINFRLCLPLALFYFIFLLRFQNEKREKKAKKQPWCETHGLLTDEGGSNSLFPICSHQPRFTQLPSGALETLRKIVVTSMSR